MCVPASPRRRNSSQGRDQLYYNGQSFFYSACVQGGHGDSEGFVLERANAARVHCRGVSHAHWSITTDRSLTSNANLMPVSTLTQHQHGEPDSPESVCGGTLVGGEDDDERASEPARVKRVDLSHNSLQWRLARRARRQPLQLPQCFLTACRRRRCGSAILGKWSDRSAQVLSAASAAGATYLSGCTITRRSREAGSEQRRDAERAGKCSFFLWLTSPRGPFNCEMV